MRKVSFNHQKTNKKGNGHLKESIEEKNFVVRQKEQCGFQESQKTVPISWIINDFRKFNRLLIMMEQ